MFRHEIQQYMLRRNSQDEFRARNVITRIYEVIHSAVSRNSRTQANLQEVGILLRRSCVHFHVHILPASLLIPQQALITYLKNEGCEVRPMKAFHDHDDLKNEDCLRWKCWKYFECPQTRDGRKLNELITRAVEEMTQQEILRQQPTPKPSSRKVTFGILKDSGPQQPTYFELTSDARTMLVAPPDLIISRWKHDPQFASV